MPANRPYVFLDVDGALIPFALGRLAACFARRCCRLPHRVNPRIGLTDADFSTIRQWLTT
ncbi:hypothetical protein ACN27F_24775 [Solwaraspora sp. WMMB335]|uniref:hypothetical protein n=1 Tax=Solwaraspora sp. WMMB335 TaxID=3404118 RepID=UPI003B93AE95